MSAVEIINHSLYYRTEKEIESLYFQTHNSRCRVIGQYTFVSLPFYRSMFVR